MSAAQAHGRPKVRLLLLTVAITAAAGGAAWQVSRSYYAIAPYHYDSASYRAIALRLDGIREREGNRQALSRNLQLRDSLDVTLRLLLAPSSLRSAWGHLVVLLPFMGLFLFLLGLYVVRRTGSLALAALMQALVFVSPLVFDPLRGIADYWKDNLGVWLLGAAACAWLLGGEARRVRWAALAGTLMGLLAWQRTVLAVLGLAALAPAIAVEAAVRFRRHGPSALRPLLAFTGPLLLLCVPLVAIQFRRLFFYYSVVGYGYRSAWGTARYLGSMIVAHLVVTLSALAGVWLLLLRHGRGAPASWRDARMALAWAACFPLAIAGSSALYQGFTSAWPLLLIVAIAGCTAPSCARHDVVVPLALMVVAASAAQGSLLTARARAHALSFGTTRSAYDALSGLLAGRRYGLAFHDLRDILINHAAFHGRARLSRPVTFTSIHDSFYAAELPARGARDVVEWNLARLEEAPGTLAAAYCSPEGIPAAGQLGPDGDAYGPFAREVASGIAAELQRRPRWRALRRFETAFGCVLLYEYQGEAGAYP